MSEEIIVFGRWPAPGRVKTRLAAAVGAEAAAEIYRGLLDHTLQEALATHRAVTLALDGRPETGGWIPPEGVRITAQSAGDLGERMHHAFGERFASGATAVVLLGSDIPGVSAELVEEAFTRLGRIPVVIGPAADGGYWAVGQTRPGLDIFSGVPWSTPTTLAETRKRLRVFGVDFAELARLRDIDTIGDLEAVLSYNSAGTEWLGSMDAVLRLEGGSIRPEG